MLETCKCNASQSDWVSEYAKCSVEGLFNELVRVIKSDISSFDQLSDLQRNGLGSYKCEVVGQLSAVVREVDGGGHFKLSSSPIRIEGGMSCLKVSHAKDLLFQVSPKWNTTSLTCDFVIAEQPHTIEQLSARTIAKLLFTLVN